jgi:predicted exporter
MRKPLALLWLLVVLAAAFLGAIHGLRLDSDIMALLPREDRDPALQEAKDRMAQVLAGRVVILVGHPQRDTARAHAETLRRTLVESGLARPDSDIPSAETIKRLGAAYFPHHASLLADGDRRLLQQGRAADLVTRALSQIFGFAGPADSRLLARDPFLLFPAFLGALPVPANRLSLDDGMLSVVDDGTTWVMVSLTLAGEPMALDFQRRFMATFEDWRAAAPPDLKALRLGAVFFAHAGADRAMAESSRIGAVSLIGTVLLVLVAFRSAGPLLLSVTAIAVGLVLALSVCLALFGSIHVAAQLFGASLIGIAVDYALLYFGQIFTPRRDPAHRLAHVMPGLTLGAVTTVIGYATLALSPFPGLKQVAVFSAVGLVGSFVTVILWFPLLDRSPSRRLNPWVAQIAAGLWNRRARVLILPLLALAAMGLTRLHADDDVRHQQGLSPILVAEQAEIQRLAGFAASTQFFMIEGGNEQQVLEREEQLGAHLAGRVGWQSAARFVPSARRQAEDADLLQRALVAPHLAAYRTRLGMAEPPAETAPSQPLILADIRATAALPFLDILVINQHLHVVTLEGPVPPDLPTGLEGIRLVDPTGDITLLLAVYRHRALALLAASCLFMVPLLAWRYGWRGAIRVMAPAVTAIVLTPPLLALAGVGFSFFCAMALVLVLSIGTDYAVFCAEDRHRDPVTLVSIALAMTTTLLSFGLLGLSDMAAVRAFGLTMLVGVFLAFLLAPLARR